MKMGCDISLKMWSLFDMCLYIHLRMSDVTVKDDSHFHQSNYIHSLLLNAATHPSIQFKLPASKSYRM